jgi:hypothetical protein
VRWAQLEHITAGQPKSAVGAVRAHNGGAAQECGGRSEITRGSIVRATLGLALGAGGPGLESSGRRDQEGTAGRLHCDGRHKHTDERWGEGRERERRGGDSLSRGL